MTSSQKMGLRKGLAGMPRVGTGAGQRGEGQGELPGANQGGQGPLIQPATADSGS